MAEPFNTLEAAKRLQEAGCNQKVAEEMVSQINGAISGTVATKSDIELLRQELKSDIQLLRTEIEHLDASTSANLDRATSDLRTELKSDLTNLLKWIVGVVFGATGLLFAALKLFGS